MAEPTPLIVMELNAANYDDHPAWIDRLGYIVETIQNVQANVVCLSEIRYTQTNSFNQLAGAFWQMLGLPAPLEPASMATHLLNLLNGGTDGPWQQSTVIVDQYSTDPPQWEGLSILTPLQFTGAGSFSMASGDGNARATQYLTVTTPSGNQVPIYNTHFALDEPSRISDAQTVVANVAGSSFIFTGDLNAEPSDQALYILTQAGFVDVWAKLGSGDGLTFASPLPVKRIDYLYCGSDLTASAQSIVNVPAAATGTSSYYTTSDGGTLFASDHIGLCATFDL